MTNDEAQMTKECLMTKSELKIEPQRLLRASSLGLPSTFVLCHSSLLLPSLRRCSVTFLLLAFAFAVGCRSVRRGEPIVGPLNTIDPEVQKGHIVFQEN